MTIVRLSLVWITALGCVGCSLRDPIPAAQVLNHGNCTITQPGMRMVSYKEVAGLRGSKLLNMTTPRVNQGPDLLLLAISKGRQPTPGYRFELSDAFMDDATATIELRWHEPVDESLQSQMITHPCIVVGLERGVFTQVRAIDEHGNPIGELSI